MSAIIARLRNEPAVLIGIIGTAIVAALQSLAGNGVIGADLVDTIARLVGTVEQPGPAVVLLAGIVIRFFVYGPETVAAIRGTR